MFCECLTGRPYLRDTRETQLSPSVLTLRIPVMRRAHASFHGIISREIPMKTLLSSIAWIFTLFLSITQPLQLNPTIKYRVQQIEWNYNQIWHKIKPTKHIVVNYNFTYSHNMVFDNGIPKGKKMFLCCHKSTYQSESTSAANNWHLKEWLKYYIPAQNSETTTI